MPGLKQAVRDLGMARGAFGLEHRLLVVIETQPIEPVEDGIDRFRRGPGLVGILDPQQRLAAVMAREQPVEQRGARAADMKETRGRGRETRDDGPFGGRCCVAAVGSICLAACHLRVLPLSMHAMSDPPGPEKTLYE